MVTDSFEFKVGNLVGLLYTNRIGIVVEMSNRSLVDDKEWYSYFIHYMDGKNRWEVKDAIEFIARG